MNTALKWLVFASIINMIGNSFGTVVAFQQNLVADWGGFLKGQDVLQDFLGFKGTALSAPLPFLLIQLMVTLLVLRPDRSRSIGISALTFIGLLIFEKSMSHLVDPLDVSAEQAGLQTFL